MTYYALPGDKIIVCAPGSFAGNPTDEETVEEIRAAFADLGVTVVQVFLVHHLLPLTVVAVSRERQAIPPAPQPRRSQEKLKLVDLETDLPWQQAFLMHEAGEKFQDPQ